MMIYFLVIKLFIVNLFKAIDSALLGFFFFEDTMLDKEGNAVDRANAPTCILKGYYPQGVVDEDEVLTWGIPMEGIHEDVSIIDIVKYVVFNK